MEIDGLLNDDDEVQAEVDAQGSWFDMVRERIHKLKSWLKNRQKQNSSEEAEKVDPTTSTPKSTSCTPKMKLPTTDLRKFSGDVLDWPEFWGIFRVAVNENIDIPPVQKVVYLKSLLTGEAAGYVANFKTEEANYDVAVERLQSRYGKDEVQRNRLMTKLADMKPIDQSNKAMRDAVDELCATVRALQVQGVTPDQYGALLMPLIESKLPKDWRLEWARQKAALEKDTVTFSKLLEFLDQELEIRESADQSDEKSQTSRNKSTEKGKSPLPTASGLMAKSVTCTFCKGTHSPKECSIPMSVEDRFNKVREAKACFRCARTGHRMVTCKHRKPCQCGRGPHILQLCKTGGVKNPDAGNHPSVNAPNHPSWNPAAPPFLPSQSQTPSTSQPQQAAATSSAKNADIKSAGVMMRTVCVAIGNVTVRALCDTGATFTLMSSVVSKMGSLGQSDHNCNVTLSKSKIPVYARDYRNEYLYIRGINKECGEFVKYLYKKELFKSPKADNLILYINRFVKAQRLGYLSDTSEIYFNENDVSFIESLELQLDDYRDLFCDEYSYEFDEEKYNNNVENDYPGFKKFFECVSPLIGK